MGKDVTEAVLRKVSKSGIFKQDHSFLLRLAYVESKFGEGDYTFRKHYYGGIWQVEESVFRITQTSPSTLFAHYEAIQTKFQIDWQEATWDQLVIPLYSGLAAALYFTCVSKLEPMPQTVPGQFEYWKDYYRPFGDFNKFKNDTEWLGNQTKCRGKLDLCIVLDGSGSIGQANYQLAKDFVASLITSFTQEKRFYHLRIPPEGITVNTTDIAGKTNGYWSRTEEVPSEAVHDGTITNGLTYIPPPSHYGHRAKRDIVYGKEYESNVYITIEGVEEINNYTLSFVDADGNREESGAGYNTSAKYIFFFVICFTCICQFIK